VVHSSGFIALHHLYARLIIFLHFFLDYFRSFYPSSRPRDRSLARAAIGDISGLVVLYVYPIPRSGLSLPVRDFLASDMAWTTFFFPFHYFIALLSDWRKLLRVVVVSLVPSFGFSDLYGRRRNILLRQL
jgi:hypothetical protein